MRAEDATIHNYISWLRLKKDGRAVRLEGIRTNGPDGRSAI